MKETKKNISMLVLVTAMLTVGCGDGSDENPSDENTDQSETEILDTHDSGANGSDSNMDTGGENGTDTTVRDTGTDTSVVDTGHDTTILDTGTDTSVVDTGHDTTVVDTGTDSSVGQPTRITVHFEEGNAGGGAIIYAMWLENAQRTVVQNLYICNKLLNGSLTGTALPYWSLNKQDSSDVDGLSGATVLPEFSVTRTLSDDITTQFTVYVELDHSFDGNDWFNDQPALLYAVDVNLNQPLAEYTLQPIGWTVDAPYSLEATSGTPTADAGELVTEMRYITNLESNGDFGAADSRTATRMVKTLTATFE